MNPLKLWHLSFVQTEVKPPEHQVGKLKLSEAIRIGAKMKPQAFSRFQDNLSSCALGAAFDALGGYDTVGSEWVDYFLKEFSVSLKLLRDVILLNDTHHKSREQIADWLESEGY